LSEVEGQTLAPADPTTGQGLIEFLDKAAEKGWINVSSAKALRTASHKILSIDAGWEDIDLRSLDADSVFERFRNLKRNDYSDASLRVYRSRFNQALKMHLARLDNDPQWKSYGPSGRPGTGAVKRGNRKAVAQPTDSVQTEETPVLPAFETRVTPPTATKASLMQFPYPLRDDLDVHLSLPRDLTKSEAERLGRYINSLVREERLAITAGDSV
jgi:hypothetical protein